MWVLPPRPETRSGAYSSMSCLSGLRVMFTEGFRPLSRC